MGVIYKITNLINNKIYIGQTKIPEPKRWQAHVWNANNNSNNDCPYLNNAINKYGKENFKREIIEECSNELLSEREKYWIKYYDTTNREKGYNLTQGGDGYTKYNDEDILNAYEKTLSVRSGAKLLNMSSCQFSKRLRSLGIIAYNTTIFQFDLDGNYIATYNSFAEAVRILNGKEMNNACRKNYKYKNYIWIYEDENISIQQVLEELNKKNYKEKIIQQFTLDTKELVGEYVSALEASKKTGIDYASIKAALRGEQVSSGDYLWHKINSNLSLQERYNKYLLSRRCCQIDELNEKGEIIATYPSAGFVEKRDNLSYNCVKMVCDGKKKSVNNRFFQYNNKEKRKLLSMDLI